MKDNALYLEVDEDITSAIDKLSKTQGSSVQIVVPKRSTMLQSIINLKLLKKAADGGGKELVLVTSDRIASELASRVGLAVAPSIGAKAVLSDAKIPEALSTTEEIIDEGDPEPPPPVIEPKPKASKKPLLKRIPVSEGLPVAPPAPSEVSVSALEPVAAPEAVPLAGSSPKKPPKIPNFNLLQKRLLWIVAAVVLVVGYLVAMYVFTSAKVTLYASGTKVDIDTTYSVDPSLKSADQANAVLAGQTVTVSKDLTGPFTPTGKQDAGTKAGGNMTVYNSYDTNAHTLVAGTRFQAPDGNIFVSATDISVPGATPTLVGGHLGFSPGQTVVAVTAAQNGDSYNEAPASYTIPGLSASEQSQQNGIYGKGDQMSGGASKTVTIVVQSDVDTEKAALLDKDKDNFTSDLQARVPNGYTAITASQATNTSNVSSSPTVGAVGDTASLTVHVTYTELAVPQADYAALVEAQEQKQVGDQNQIYDNGLAAAQVTASGTDSSGRQSFHLTTVAFSGAKLDKAALATKLKGLRYGDAASLASGLPGVARADISIWPGWVASMPSRTSKITVTIQVAGNQ
jgi:hypothetical protein